MTDLEITKACAEAMGLKIIATAGDGPDVYVEGPSYPGRQGYDIYFFNDDAQAMALVKKFGLLIGRGNFVTKRRIVMFPGKPESAAMCESETEINKAICECVAKMQKGK